MTASHGVGRKPGDGKAQHQCIASPSVTPPGLHFILSHSGGCARKAGLPPASVLSPTSWAQISSGFQPEKFQFVVESKQYSLIAGAINSSIPTYYSPFTRHPRESQTMKRAYPRYADRLQWYNVTFFTKHLWRSQARVTCLAALNNVDGIKSTRKSRKTQNSAWKLSPENCLLSAAEQDPTLSIHNRQITTKTNEIASVGSDEIIVWQQR